MKGDANLRIALLLESDGPGGAEWMLLNLAEALRARGHHILPVGPAQGCGWLAERFRGLGFEPATFFLRRAVDPVCALALNRLLRHHNIDVVHSHEFSMGVYGAAATRWAGLPHLITMHGGKRYAKRLRRRIALRWAFRSSAGVVAVSEATRLDLKVALGYRGPIHVIPNGVPRRVGDRNRLRHELDIAESETLIVAVGSLYPVKGYDVLIRALANLDPSLNWRIAIAGQGQEEARLKALARNEGLDGRIQFLGYRDDVPDVLAAADVFVMPSMSEGMPLALLEAMTAGLPIVASQVGGIPDALANGAGVLVTPGDANELARALGEILGTAESRGRLGILAAAAASARFGVDLMTDAYERQYREAVRNGMIRTGRPVPEMRRETPCGT